MKTDTQPGLDEPAASTEGEPASPTGEEQSGESKERDIDELRRFRVRTVPPDMRRQWMLAETPAVSTVELQDTVPPNKRPSNAPPEPNTATPRPLFGAPRVSSTKATRRLPRVVPRGERATRAAIVAIALFAAVLLVGLRWKGDAPRQESVVPQTPILQFDKPPPAIEAARNVQRKAPEPRDSAASPPTNAPPLVPARLNSLAGPESNPNPSAKTERPRTEKDLKLPPSTPAASGKIPPAQKPRPESDIKRPLFGQ